MFARLIREPLLHFLLFGAGLFFLYDLVAPGTSSEQSIVVTVGQQQALQARFESTWKRSPKQNEMQALIEDYVLNEAYYREAKSLGMDEGDRQVRQRLRQKMTFVLAQASAQIQPTEQELTTFFKANKALFSRPATYSFEQFLLPDGASDSAIEAITLSLTSGTHVDRVASLLADNYQSQDSKQLARLFGDEFVQRISNLDVGQWSAPIQSKQGQHLIKLSNKVPEYTPALEQIRSQVTEHWIALNKREITQALNEKLLAKYTVVVEDVDG